MAEYLLDKQKSYLATIESGKEEVDFTMTFYGFCIVSEKFANILAAEKISDCLIVPLSFDKELSQKYYLLVDPLRYDCVDERNSDFQKFLENDPVRPDLAGRYRAFFKLIINASKADNADIFRLTNEDATVIVSQKIKNIYENNHLTGANFTKVTI
ncbi:imm11 family protein [Acinetobacter soli]|uniref:imm11 family protein n=1 Tax=Acinetobacter soli TaxID=487316 RepID=UPI001D1726C7|nr:DUF1629 domain-containing protein [Acinetobacter soli]WEI11746.1 hypothetical protein PX667_09405 [Acinetobacter soli]WEI15784.1 hypothetical protein PX668_02200 [Acinetobacter soli]